MSLDIFKSMVHQDIAALGAALVELCGFEGIKSDIRRGEDGSARFEAAHMVDRGVWGDYEDADSIFLSADYRENKVVAQLRRVIAKDEFSLEASFDSASSEILVRRLHKEGHRYHVLNFCRPLRGNWISPQGLKYFRHDLKRGAGIPRGEERFFFEGVEWLLQPDGRPEKGQLLGDCFGQWRSPEDHLDEFMENPDRLVVSGAKAPEVVAGRPVAAATIDLPDARYFLDERGRVDLPEAICEVADGAIVRVNGSPISVNGWGRRLFRLPSRGGVMKFAELGLVAGGLLLIAFLSVHSQEA